MSRISSSTPPQSTDQVRWTQLYLGLGFTTLATLILELSLTRIFSVVFYYHLAFLAISIALFGLSASGVFAYVARRRIEGRSTDTLLAWQSVVYAVFTLIALFALVRLRVGLNYSRENLVLMLTIYALAALPFFTGGLVITLAISRLASRVNAVYASDLLGAAAGCLVLIPLLDRVARLEFSYWREGGPGGGAWLDEWHADPLPALINNATLSLNACTSRKSRRAPPGTESAFHVPPPSCRQICEL